MPLLSQKMFLLFIFQVKINTTEQTGDVSMASSSHVVSFCVAHDACAGKELALNKCLLIESKLQFYQPLSG